MTLETHIHRAREYAARMAGSANQLDAEAAESIHAVCDAIKEARNKALDDAAVACVREAESWGALPTGFTSRRTAEDCATRILSLKEPTS